MSAPYLHVPKDFKQLRQCLQRGMKIRKDRMYYALEHAEAFGEYMRRYREKCDEELLDFAVNVMGDKTATLGAL